MSITNNNLSTATIGIVLNTSWNIYNFRLGLIRALRENGYQVILIAPYDEYSEKLKKEGFIYHHININNKGINPLEDMRLIYDFYKLYQKIKPDILLSYTIKPNIYSSLAAKKLNIPVINNITGLGTVFLNNNISSHIARWLYKLSINQNSVVFQNKDDMNLFLDEKIVNQHSVTLIPGSGINIERFKASEIRPAKNKKMVFLLIARLIKDKGIEEYIEAIREIRDSKYSEQCSFKILGSLYLSNPTAISEETLNSWIEEELIEYLGHSDNVQNEIDKVDCVVLPSYREGLSRVLLEAASMEKPIITTDVPGCRDVVDDNINGYLVEKQSSKELVVAMKKMMNLSSFELEKMGKKGRKKVVNNFSEKKIIDEYFSLLKVLGLKKSEKTLEFL